MKAPEGIKESHWKSLVAYCTERILAGQSEKEAIEGAFDDYRAICEEMLANKTDRARRATKELTKQVFGLAVLSA